MRKILVNTINFTNRFGNDQSQGISCHYLTSISEINVIYLIHMHDFIHMHEKRNSGERNKYCMS